MPKFRNMSNRAVVVPDHNGFLKVVQPNQIVELASAGSPFVRIDEPVAISAPARVVEAAPQVLIEAPLPVETVETVEVSEESTEVASEESGGSEPVSRKRKRR